MWIVLQRRMSRCVRGGSRWHFPVESAIHEGRTARRRGSRRQEGLCAIGRGCVPGHRHRKLLSRIMVGPSGRSVGPLLPSSFPFSLQSRMGLARSATSKPLRSNRGSPLPCEGGRGRNPDYSNSQSNLYGHYILCTIRQGKAIWRIRSQFRSSKRT